MQKEEDYRIEHLKSGESDLNFVVSVIFLSMKMVTNQHGSFYELLDCCNGETKCVDRHELLIRQDVVDVEQLVFDSPHREATDDSDGPDREKIEHLIKHLEDALNANSCDDYDHYKRVKSVISVS